MLFAGFLAKKAEKHPSRLGMGGGGQTGMQKPKLCVFVCGVRFNYIFTFNSRLLLLLTEHNNDNMDCLALQIEY